MGSFAGVFTDDEGFATGGDRESMNNAFGSAGASKGGPLDSPEENFKGRSMSEAALGDPGNALPSVSNGAKPSSDGSFDSLSDRSWKV
jgi:hypothetical protein